MEKSIMKKAVAYLRVSTEGQVDRYGFDRQLAAINEYAETHGIEVVAVFREEGVSGATELKQRIAFGDLLNYLEENPDVKCVMVSELSRLARDVIIQENFIRDFHKKGLELISVKEPDLDGNDPTRKLIRQILGVINEYEREMIAIRMQAGRIQKARKGEHASGRVPLGYKSVTKGTKRALEKDDEDAQIVRLIFELREQKGMSYREIAGYLNKHGYKPKYAKEFGYSTVRKICLNPKYKGIVSYQEDGQKIVAENKAYCLV